MSTPNLPLRAETLIQMGINPRTGLPYKVGGDSCHLQDNIRKVLRIQDEQQAINRYEWYNLPDIDGNELERLLYYRYTLMAFYLPNVNKDGTGRFYFLPYALYGVDGIDVYGRYNDVTPVPVGASTDGKGKDKPWIVGLHREVVKDFGDANFETIEECLDAVEKKCVLLYDYSKQLSQSGISRQILQDGLIEFQSELIPMMRTNLINSVGTAGVRVNNEDEESNVFAANSAKQHAVLEGNGWIPVIGKTEFQELGTDNVAKAEQFLMSYQAIDNLRMQSLGSGAGNMYQKQAHMLQSEQDMNESNVDSIFQDGLYQRQKFCTLFNTLFGTNIWCEPKALVNMTGAEDEQDVDSKNSSMNQEGGDENVQQ